MTPYVMFYGPHTWEVCEACNIDRHICAGCGDELRHAETLPGPNLHWCYTPEGLKSYGIEVLA